MNIIDQFKEIIEKRTRNGFHDSILIELKIKLEAKRILIKIEHWKDGDKEGEEKIFIGKFVFMEISNIHLNNKVNCFGIEDEISSFDIEKNDDNVFILTGIKGWIFSFSSTSFKYKEKLKEIYTHT